MENNNIIQSLILRLKELNSVSFQIPDQIEQLTEDPNSNLQLIKLKSGTEVYAKLVVGSDGRYSAVKEKKGISTYGWMYN